ncbi:MAG: hypothetical protein J6K75_04895 [Erysipelotrichaceae bacterium]|nr:hypothetical protein [Erysipelotrichaceae bacterium]MBQ7888240.1 hypothetical protein [Erysipelotrichaceae bacterium]
MTFTYAKKKTTPPARRIINMSEEKGTTYYAVRISYSDGSSEHYYNLKANDLKRIP